MHRTRPLHAPPPFAAPTPAPGGLRHVSTFLDAGALVLWTTAAGNYRPAPEHPRPTLLMVVTPELEVASS